MLFDMFLQFRDFTKPIVWLCLGVLLFHWSWASGSAEKLLEGVQAGIFWKKISCAEIPVLWEDGGK